MESPVPTVLASGGEGSSSFVLFEVAMVLVAIASFFVIRRRRRMLEQRAALRYERLSRVELGELQPSTPQAAPATSSVLPNSASTSS